MRLARSFRLLAVLLDWLARNSGPADAVSPRRALMARLLAGISLEPRQLFPATAQLVVERRDSS